MIVGTGTGTGAGQFNFSKSGVRDEFDFCKYGRKFLSIFGAGYGTGYGDFSKSRCGYGFRTRTCTPEYASEYKSNAASYYH